MKIRKYNQFLINESYKELEYIVDEDGSNQMMYETSAIMNLVRNYDDIADVIKTTLSKNNYHKLFGQYMDLIKNKFDLFVLFITQVLNYKDLQRMFTNVKVQKGAD